MLRFFNGRIGLYAAVIGFSLTVIGFLTVVVLACCGLVTTLQRLAKGDVEAWRRHEQGLIPIHKRYRERAGV